MKTRLVTFFLHTLVVLGSIYFVSGADVDPACLNTIYPCSNNYVGILILLAFYGILLSYSAKLISDGSELMLELFPKWGSVIGALLLPILGAVPDAAIIVVSGALGSASEAQDQLGVGVGTLAGSTIMLLTVPWMAGSFLGRCDRNALGRAIDGKCKGFSFTRQGISVDDDTPVNARIMLGTSVAYLIIQIVAFFYLADPSGKAAHHVEGPAALAGFLVCVIGLVAYCIYQVLVPKLTEKKKEKLDKEREARYLRLKALHVVEQMRKNAAKKSSPDGISVMSQDSKEAHALNLGLKWKARALEAAKARKQKLEETDPLVEREHEEEESEEDPAKHFKRNLFKGILLMVIGTASVAFFSDPMVEVISDFAEKADIKPFFVSFLITPYCSNASELISSLLFAAKKKKENASLTFSQLYGAATMNNTLCLGIFYALIYFRGLYWAFTAETLAILLVTWIVGIIGSFKQDWNLWWTLPIISLYPFSLFFVWLLESVAHWT